MPVISHADVIRFLEELMPLDLCESWDNSGLQIGSGRRELTGVLLCLDVTPAVLDRARQAGASFIFAHHPLLFRPLKSVSTDRYPGNVLAAAVAADLTVYAAHTNLDLVPGGVNDALADALGLVNTRVLQRTRAVESFKLVTFVPPDHLDEVSDALFTAGAGVIDSYSRCSFSTPGIGTFFPAADAAPFIGAAGEANEEEEMRLELVVDEYQVEDVLQALHRTHPYETPAYDLLPRANRDRFVGFGRVGEVPGTLTPAALVDLVKERLGVDSVRLIGMPAGAGNGDEGAAARSWKAAVCGGSGFGFYGDALRSGVDVYITGDVKYHEAREAELAGLPVIDAGHFATERPVLPVMAEEFRRFLKRNDADGLPVICDEHEADPWLCR
ncbi:MAG: Nif3-like dinuclear metal center hexameric protein [Deltaproteobacteria bacterium]|nr:Nif3-like dinuclear metal center hexameric protein [Candidatus Anaeroferrophillacea bacterium]